MALACAGVGLAWPRRGSNSSRRATIQRCRSMYVSSDSFGGRSPEKMASLHLQRLFTFCAAKIILAQLEGSGRGSLGSFNANQYQLLTDHLANMSTSDPEAWLRSLLAKDPALALRVMEVRRAYCSTSEGFEWATLERITKNAVHKSNDELLRAHLDANFRVAPRPEEPGSA